MLEVNSDIATKELQRLGVEVQLRSRVKESVIGSNGQYEIILSSGTTITTDLYIPTFGLAPNSSYVPAKFLTSQGFIKVDEFLQVTGTKNIWAIGDVSDLEQSQWIKAEYQSAHLAKNLIKILQNQAPQAYKKSTTRKYHLGSETSYSTLIYSLPYSNDGTFGWQRYGHRSLRKLAYSDFCGTLSSKDTVP
jgi:NADH dehydrogenase FAD-containing subunit